MHRAYAAEFGQRKPACWRLGGMAPPGSGTVNPNLFLVSTWSRWCEQSSASGMMLFRSHFAESICGSPGPSFRPNSGLFEIAAMSIGARKGPLSACKRNSSRRGMTNVGFALVWLRRVSYEASSASYGSRSGQNPLSAVLTAGSEKISVAPDRARKRYRHCPRPGSGCTLAGRGTSARRPLPVPEHNCGT